MGQGNIELVQALDKIRLGNLYVHNDTLPNTKFTTAALRHRKVYLVETLAVINALVEKGTMLLYGGHGGGKTTLAKYLGQIFYGYSKDSIEDCVLRGHPELTEEKILGGLDIAQLTGAKKLNDKKKVDVIWNDFVVSPWKIIDELNRLSPYAQNILLSLLAESSVKYHNESKVITNYSLFATMNPKDDGNTYMSLPFLDRFALALPITMPDYESLSTIGKKDKVSKQDNLPSYLENFDLKVAQEQVRDMTYSDEAELFINIIISSYRLCDRISKESNSSLTVEKGLCKGCHYNAPEKVCNKVIHPLSVRVKEDLYRYGKALAWYLGDSKVEKKHIEALAPYMIWHRSSINKTYKNELKDERFEAEQYSLNLELEATKELIQLISDEFEGLKILMKDFERIKKGKLSQEEFDKFVIDINDSNNNFLITKKDIIPVLENEYKPVYSEIINLNQKIKKENDLESLSRLKDELSFRYDIPNRQYLADLIEKSRRKISVKKFKEKRFQLNFENFMERLSSECPELNDIIKSRFTGEFNPGIRKVEVLSDIQDSQFDLTMEKINDIGGTFKLRFNYRGPENNSVFEFLESHGS